MPWMCMFADNLPVKRTVFKINPNNILSDLKKALLSPSNPTSIYNIDNWFVEYISLIRQAAKEYNEAFFWNNRESVTTGWTKVGKFFEAIQSVLNKLPFPNSVLLDKVKDLVSYVLLDIRPLLFTVDELKENAYLYYDYIVDTAIPTFKKTKAMVASQFWFDGVKNGIEFKYIGAFPFRKRTKKNLEKAIIHEINTITKQLPEEILNLLNMFRGSIKIDGHSDTSYFIFLSNFIHKNTEPYRSYLVKCAIVLFLDEYLLQNNAICHQETITNSFEATYIVNKEEASSILKTLHDCFDRKKGKQLALYMECAIDAGLITKPTFSDLKAEFSIEGSAQGFNNYLQKGKFTDQEKAPIIAQLNNLS